MAKAIEQSPKDTERYATLWDIAVEACGEIYNAISVIPTPIGIGAYRQRQIWGCDWFLQRIRKDINIW